MYQNMTGSTTKNRPARRKNRNILCLLGGSRQDVAVQAHEATVFRGFCPVAPIIRCMNFPTAADGGKHRTNLTGSGAPVLDKRLLREE